MPLVSMLLVLMVTMATLPDGVQCASEGEICSCEMGYVWYGAGSKWVGKDMRGSGECSNDEFSDPLYGVVKKCFCVKSNPPSRAICAKEGEYCQCDAGLVWYGSE